MYVCVYARTWVKAEEAVDQERKGITGTASGQMEADRDAFCRMYKNKHHIMSAWVGCVLWWNNTSHDDHYHSPHTAPCTVKDEVV